MPALRQAQGRRDRAAACSSPFRLYEAATADTCAAAPGSSGGRGALVACTQARRGSHCWHALRGPGCAGLS